MPGGPKVNNPNSVKEIFAQVQGGTPEEKAKAAQEMQAKLAKEEQMRQQGEKSGEKGQKDLSEKTKGKEQEAQKSKSEHKKAEHKTELSAQRSREALEQKAAKAQKTETQRSNFLTQNSLVQKAKHQMKDEAKRSQETPESRFLGWQASHNKATPKKLRDPQTFQNFKAKLPQAQFTRDQVRTPPKNKTLNPQKMTLFYHKNKSQPLTQSKADKGLFKQFSESGMSRKALTEKALRSRFSFQPLKSGQLKATVDRAIASQSKFLQTQKLFSKANTAVVIRGNLVFVKDGQKVRVFRLLKGGKLKELPSEDSKGEALSSEAKKSLQEAIRNKANIGKKEYSLENHEDEKTEESQKTQSSEQAHEELDSDIKFTLLLHEVLEEDREVGHPLGDSDPTIEDKEAWEDFFTLLAKTGNQEKQLKKKLAKIVAFLLRGKYQNKDGKQRLVGDLKYMNGERAREEKFIQIEVSETQVKTILSKIKKGGVLNQEQLKKLLGEELQYHKMAHQADENQYAQGSSAEEGIIFDPKKEYDPYAAARMEERLFGNKRKALPSKTQNPDPLPSDFPKTVPADIFTLLNLKNRHTGEVKTFMVLLYVVAITAILFLGLIWF